VSDGLAGDLAKLCVASRISAVIDAPSIPKSAAAADLFARSAVGLEILVSGGDDYEILCTVPEAHADAFVDEASLAGVAVSAIGTVIAGQEPPRFLDGQGNQIRLSRLSYSHF
jgi:thiamine-monophosphate kinase